MTTKPPKAHPQNVPGPFYVEDGCCLLCDVPRSLAPELFHYTADGKHCYVRRQPENQAELEKMCAVLKTQDLICIRCRSRDRVLLEQLERRGLLTACDFTE